MQGREISAYDAPQPAAGVIGGSQTPVTTTITVVSMSSGLLRVGVA
jgi:hypothetical protein